MGSTADHQHELPAPIKGHISHKQWEKVPDDTELKRQIEDILRDNITLTQGGYIDKLVELVRNYGRNNAK